MMNVRWPVTLIGMVVILCSCDGYPPSRPSPTAAPTPTATATPQATPISYVINGTGESTIEQAHARLQAEDRKTYLIVVSEASNGVEGEVYRDLRRRNIRMTTGPDEGIDTHGLFCYPNCVFVPKEEVNALGVERWINVLRHEYRHIVQATNNANMASDFRAPGGQFTPYAAFSEVCADYGLNVSSLYHAQERMEQLKQVMGEEQQPLIDQACSGEKAAYEKLVQEYNRRQGSEQAFAQLFAPYD